MIDIVNVEVYHIETTKESTFAHISFQDLRNRNNSTDGYDHIKAPMNLRPIQLSSRGNVLVCQSDKNFETASGS